MTVGGARVSVRCKAVSTQQPEDTESAFDTGSGSIDGLVGSNKAVVELEKSVNKATIGFALLIIDKFFEDRPYARFYALETVARVPYFAFLSVLHTYETIGWWRRADYLKVHFAQTMNEFHHLLIMEALGGDEKFADRFLAQHMAVFYYWICVTQYLISPRMAYNLSEQVEEHAYHTYDKFLSENEADLKAQPPPSVAVQYYTKGDLYLFDEFQTTAAETRRPTIANLYDVFMNVRNDEAEHMKTMQFCQQPGSAMRSPHDTEACELLLDSVDLDEMPAACTDNDEGDSRVCEGVLDCALTEFSGTPRRDRRKQALGTTTTVPNDTVDQAGANGAIAEENDLRQKHEEADSNNAVELKRTNDEGKEEERKGSEADDLQAAV